MGRLSVLVLAVLMVLSLAASAFAADGGIPHLINYQGMLTNDAGSPLNGNFSLTFRIFDAPSAGNQEWGETQNNIPVENGLFCVILGSVNPIDLPFDKDYWLEIEVGILGKLSPRARLTSVPWAYRAQWADTSDYGFKAKMADTADYATVAVTAQSDGDWTMSGDSLYRLTGNVGIRTSSPTSPLTILPVLGPDIDFEGAGGWNADIMADRQFNVGTSNASTFSIVTNQEYRLLVQGGGNIGIRTTSPAAALEIVGSGIADHLKLTNTDGGSPGPALYLNALNRDWAMVGTNPAASGGDQKLVFRDYTAAEDRVVIDSAGNVGIGTSSPDEKMTLPYDSYIGWEYSAANSLVAHRIGKSSNGAGPLEFVTTHNPGPTGKIFSFKRSEASEIFTVLYSGNVGIGTNSPERPLHISDVMRLQPRASAPTSPSEGDIYVNSSDHHIYCYLNGVWRQLDPSP